MSRWTKRIGVAITAGAFSRQGHALVHLDSTGNILLRATSLLWRGFKMTSEELIARGLYHTGLMRVVQKVSNLYELRPDSAPIPLRWRRATRPKFAILCYHRIGTRGIPFFSALPPAAFEAQIRYLREHYRIVSFSQLVRELQNPQTDQQTVAITFDDGYRDLWTHAFPILQKYEAPATIFLIVGSIETGEAPWYDRVFLALKNAPVETLDLFLDHPRRFLLSSPAARFQAAWEIMCYLRTLSDRRRRQVSAALEAQVKPPESELKDRMLSWGQVQTMHRAGISFGSHTMTHPVVSQLAPAEIERELAESKRVLEERLCNSVGDFAYPFGKPADCGPDAEEVLLRCGYRSAVTTISGINTFGTNPYRLRRLQIPDDSSLAAFAFRLNQLFLCLEGENTQADSTIPSLLAENAQRGTRKAAE